MAEEVQGVLRSIGPSLSSAVAVELEQMFHLTPGNARARVRLDRLPPEVSRLDLAFPRGASFLYLAGQFATSVFWSRLSQALEGTKGAYARAIWALQARGGLMPIAHFNAAAATSEADRQLSGETVLGRLVEAGLFSQVEVPGIGSCIGFSRTANTDEAVIQMRARLLAEQVLMDAVHTWARKLSFGSWDSFAFRGDPNAKVNRFWWDITAPSYLAPIRTWNAQDRAPKPGFVVFDILLSRLNANQVRPHIYKLETLQRMKNLGRVMQFVVADSYTSEAIDELRKRGIVPATTESLFGTEVAQALTALVQILNTTAQSMQDPAQFIQIMSKLSKLEGAQGTLRGSLFEFISTDIARKTMGASVVRMNFIYRDNGREVAEVDVRAEVGSKIHFIECKGLLPNSTLADSEVEAWLTKRIPIVRAKTINNDEFRNRKLHFELWITGQLSDESNQRIAALQAQLRPSKYTITVRRGPELQTMAENSGDASLANALRQHFIQHPLAPPARPHGPGTTSTQVSLTRFGREQIELVTAHVQPMASGEEEVS